jgi:hypothetical protein
VIEPFISERQPFVKKRFYLLRCTPNNCIFLPQNDQHINARRQICPKQICPKQICSKTFSPKNNKRQCCIKNILKNSNSFDAFELVCSLTKKLKYWLLNKKDCRKNLNIKKIYLCEHNRDLFFTFYYDINNIKY